MKLLGNGLAHAMHLTIAARTSFLIVGKVILDTLAWQVFRQRSASPLFSHDARDRRQARVREIDNVITVAAVIFVGSLFGFVEEAINVLFAAGCKAMQLSKRQLLLKLDDPLRERFLLGFERSDFGSIGCQLRHQFCNARFAGASHQILESEPPLRVNSSIRHRQPAI
ncbi:hypothetical protein FHT91_005456 [Rhizobium sp. BK347]|nr:hypothetical protein [Rhizobium sp. BK252]MBB3405242.1 hypothetical protein [Rhizobium sp. BK289]MBB3417767.1 hypothetical protein [Rhizobium sp. BK284]MBB3485646.1 hypothetical protein [Rhizobium sp. BK347]